MLFVYGPYMPLRLLEEIKFWKTQEKEHTDVIREIAPNLEPQYVAMLQAWEPVFAQTEYTAEKLLHAALQCPEAIPPEITKGTEYLLHISADQSRAFVAQLTDLLAVSPAVACNTFVMTVVRHIIRESEYFLCVLATLLESREEQETAPSTEPPADAPQAIDLSQLARSETSEDRASASVPIGGHTLPPLPYAYNALEPYIDTTTMRIHHDIHHKSYVDGLNKAEKELEKARQTNDFSLVKHWERELAFHGAGHYLHTLFWNVMSPHGGGSAIGPIAKQIQKDFGSYEAFKKQFSEAAEKVEGGGWAILVWSPRSRRLEILTAEKHQNLSQWDVVPILPLDVWEHAYYLKHQNKRADYIKDWWNVVNWSYVNDRFAKASKLIWQPY